jgi:hypothetical protein
MKLHFQIITMGLFSMLFGCRHGQEKNQKLNSKQLYEITSRTDTSEGFSDIFLTITSDTKTDTSHIYIGQGLYNNKTVGLKLDIRSNLPAGIASNGELNPNGGAVWNAVKFISIGQESNNLVFALAQLYNEPAERVFTKDVLTPTLFSLNQQDVNLDKPGYYKFKLFFNDESDDENKYAEMFLNINTEEQIIELHEKDHDYRKPLLNTFTGK